MTLFLSTFSRATSFSCSILRGSKRLTGGSPCRIFETGDYSANKGELAVFQKSQGAGFSFLVAWQASLLSLGYELWTKRTKEAAFIFFFQQKTQLTPSVESWILCPRDTALVKCCVSSSLLARLFVREWAKFRYGVFDEFGYRDDSMYPPFYKKYFNNGASEESLTACVDQQWIGDR